MASRSGRQSYGEGSHLCVLSAGRKHGRLMSLWGRFAWPVVWRWSLPGQGDRSFSDRRHLFGRCVTLDGLVRGLIRQLSVCRHRDREKTVAPPLSAGKMVMLWSLLREATARLSKGVMRADVFFWSICPATMLRTSERTSSGMLGWDKTDSMFPTKLAVSASAMLNFIPRSRIEDSAELRVH